ncbi:Aldehyde dehydrogenase C-terminal [Penicillium argentinense]|uniref:Aldehyde dehydrogenase C-terminal n=1 Tax=Penicillium argentinense TaxID=1131581 RepID=A0A9W9KKK3_9EURO|nr:Aldehyde dehydrogenase C-terminal [Penicillium argentinense]KAJ5110174.1 Aldehyde dehydrogenase C-terminal [Penicillium argentinense]
MRNVDIAVRAAREAFEGHWTKAAPSERGRMLAKLANLFGRDVDIVAAIESLDNGKALTMAQGDVTNAAFATMEAGWIRSVAKRSIQTQSLLFTPGMKLSVFAAKLFLGISLS